MVNKPKIIFAIILCFVCFYDFAQVRDKKMDRFFDKKMEKSGIIGLQSAFVTDGKLAWNGSYGFQNFQTKKVVNDSTLFLIASSTKPVTALALLKLYDQNLVDLDTDINQYLPFEIVNPHFIKDKITLRMLLSHTSSIRDNWDILDPLYTLENGGDSPIELEDFVKAYLTKEGRFYNSETNFAKVTPATSWAYCNMGYVVIGYIISRISGMPFSEYVKSEVFTPLGMHNSYWFLADIPHDNISFPHVLPEKKDKAKPIRVLKHYGYPDYPDGQLRTTVTDYCQVISVILNKGLINGNRFVSEETINEFLKIQYPAINKWQAIAWNYNEFENWVYYLLMPRYPSHTGGDPGVASVVSFDPKSKTAAVVFINSPPVTTIGGKIFYLDMMKKLLKSAKRNKISK